MIRPASSDDFPVILDIINQAAEAYRGVIPPDCWHEPYMSAADLSHQIDDGVMFSVFEEDGRIAGVMGLQKVRDAVLVRHAYVAPEYQRRGVGGRLLESITTGSRRVLVGTWADARWAIDFYKRHGFVQLSADETDRLLRTYWNIPARQRETSVVLRLERAESAS